MGYEIPVHKHAIVHTSLDVCINLNCISFMQCCFCVRTSTTISGLLLKQTYLTYLFCYYLLQSSAPLQHKIASTAMDYTPRKGLARIFSVVHSLTELVGKLHGANAAQLPALDWSYRSASLCSSFFTLDDRFGSPPEHRPSASSFHLRSSCSCP